MSRTIEVDASASGSTLNVSRGDRLRVSLSETRTAGFRWQVVSQASSVVKISDDGLTPASALGGAGVHRWTVTAAQPGEATLEFEYRRSWGSSAPAQRFTLTIRVDA